MENSIKIKKYFQKRRDEYNSWSKQHTFMANKYPLKSIENKFHIDNAWRYGVIMQSVCDDMEKDIIKLI